MPYVHDDPPVTCDNPLIFATLSGSNNAEYDEQREDRQSGQTGPFGLVRELICFRMTIPRH